MVSANNNLTSFNYKINHLNCQRYLQGKRTVLGQNKEKRSEDDVIWAEIYKLKTAFR